MKFNLSDSWKSLDHRFRFYQRPCWIIEEETWRPRVAPGWDDKNSERGAKKGKMSVHWRKAIEKAHLDWLCVCACVWCFRMLTTLSWVTEMRQQRGIRLSSSWSRVSYRMTKETHVCPGRQEWPVKIPPMLGNSCFRHGNILFACCTQLLKPRLTYARLCDTIMNANGRL